MHTACFRLTHRGHSKPLSNIKKMAMNRKVCWIASPTHSSIVSGYFMRLNSSMEFDISFLEERKGAYLMDHQVLDRILVPGAALMELACSVGRVCTREHESISVLRDASIPNPL